MKKIVLALLICVLLCGCNGRTSYRKSVNLPEKETVTQNNETVKEEDVVQEETQEPVKEEVKETPVVKEEPAKEEVKPETNESTIRPSVKEAIDSYEAFIDEYCTFMKTYSESEDTTALMMQYMGFIGKLADMEVKMEKMEDDLTDAELLYYTEVMLRCSNKLLSTY